MKTFSQRIITSVIPAQLWAVFAITVEGRNRSTKHRHVTISPREHQNINYNGNVTKIELELEETPDDASLVGPIPSELDVAGEINSTYPSGIPGPGTVVVRAEEALIVILVLLLWAAAIALFFNRWGKIRMLEPYQPKFQQQHRPSCTTIDQTQLQNRRTYSKFNILCGDYPVGQELNYTLNPARPRQNSVFTGSSSSLLPGAQGIPRRTKSAFDLQSLTVLESRKECSDQDTCRNLKPVSESTKLLQRDRRTSVCQFDRTDIPKPAFRDRGMSICHVDGSPKSWQRDRGMSICQFDKAVGLSRPLQRDRGGSICQFDRMDVLARPLQRDRSGSSYHFDRMEVLARPNFSFGKPLLKERRISMCSFSQKDEEPKRSAQKDCHLSIDNIDKIEKDTISNNAESDTEKQELFAACSIKDQTSIVDQYDQPCCSKTSDVILGYKATCV